MSEKLNTNYNHECECGCHEEMTERCDFCKCKKRGFEDFIKEELKE